MVAIYHLIIALALLLASPWLLVRAASDAAFRRELAERLGNWKRLDRQQHSIWVHASSVGEVRVAEILIQSLKQEYPDRAIVLSTFTATGYQLATELNLCPVFRLPPDVAPLMGPLVSRVDPSILILIEAEFWPVLLHTCKSRNIPVVLVNGRMSKKSFRNYRLLRPLFHRFVEGINGFSMRSALDADRVRKLGIAQDKVHVLGNIKFDSLPEGQDNALPSAGENNSEPGLANARRPLAVFGSTRPGDEAPIIDAIAQLHTEFPDWSYVLVPRHPQRCDEVEALILGKGLVYKRHSELKEEDDKPLLVLVDEIGHLKDYYKDSRIAFVGGGFSPEFGGQNILEPAMCGIPVLFGPHMQNFQEEARLLKESGGGVEVPNGNRLHPALKELMSHPEEIERRGQLAAQTIADNRGAVERNLQWIGSFLNPSGH